MKGVRMTSVRLSASNPSDLESCASAAAQTETSVTHKTQPGAISAKLSALDIESAHTAQDSKAKQQQSVVQLNTDPAAHTVFSPRACSRASSDFSVPSSPGHGSPTALVSVIAAHDARATFSPAAAPGTCTRSDIETGVTACSTQCQVPATPRTFGWKVVNYCIIPLCIPALVLYWLVSLLAAAAVTFTIIPSLLFAKRLYWACPFIPYIWKSDGVRGKFGVVGSWMMRLNFEGAHCMTVLGRLFTLPLRPHLPDFYILGFPKCGTTSMAGYLKAHPGISGLAGMPGSEIFSKESHFFGGMLGRGTTTNTLLYRSFFPTLLTRWWCEVVRGVDRWMCFDACPTHACLPHVAARVKAVTPDAKLIVMVRDPAAGVFSAETMLRNMGVPLDWTLSQSLRGDASQDSRFQFSESDEAFWAQLESLPAAAPLPADLPERFYFNIHSYLMAGRYADRLSPWIKEFGTHNILLVDYTTFIAQPEQTVKEALHFVGADVGRYKFKAHPPRMKGDYKGASIDPGVAAWLNSTWFAESNAALAGLFPAGK